MLKLSTKLLHFFELYKNSTDAITLRKKHK